MAADRRFLCTRVAAGMTATVVASECACAGLAIAGDMAPAEIETSNATNAARRLVFRVS